MYHLSIFQPRRVFCVERTSISHILTPTAIGQILLKLLSDNKKKKFKILFNFISNLKFYSILFLILEIRKIFPFLLFFFF